MIEEGSSLSRGRLKEAISDKEILWDIIMGWNQINSFNLMTNGTAITKM